MLWECLLCRDGIERNKKGARLHSKRQVHIESRSRNRSHHIPVISHSEDPLRFQITFGDLPEHQDPAEINSPPSPTAIHIGEGVEFDIFAEEEQVFVQSSPPTQFQWPDGANTILETTQEEVDQPLATFPSQDDLNNNLDEPASNDEQGLQMPDFGEDLHYSNEGMLSFIKFVRDLTKILFRF